MTRSLRTTAPPLPPAADDAAVAQAAFREAMRNLAAAVTLITVTHRGQRNGCTATAVCSVTTEPPTLLACLNRSASSHGQIVGAGRFAVNILRPSHRDIALRFASGASGEARFADPRWITGQQGLPILSDALAAFECRVERRVASGSHDVFFGRVLAVTRTTGSGLLYGDGAFGTFAGTDPAQKPAQKPAQNPPETTKERQSRG